MLKRCANQVWGVSDERQMAVHLLHVDTRVRYCRTQVVLERITKTTQFREPRPHRGLHSVGITLGNEGRAVRPIT
jgi:hypothetical protein